MSQALGGEALSRAQKRRLRREQRAKKRLPG
jgi:hypothetical protein